MLLCRPRSVWSKLWFPSSHYGCESWAIKKAVHLRIGALELWCWRRLLKVRWTARRSNQSVLKEISPEYSLEGLMLKLMHSMLWPPDAKNWITGKDPDAGKDWRWEEKGTTEDGVVGWNHQLDAHEFEQVREWWWTGKPGMLQSMGWQRVRHYWATELRPLETRSLILQV